MSTFSDQIKQAEKNHEPQPEGDESGRTLAGEADRLVAEVFAIVGFYKGTEEGCQLSRALMDIFDFQNEEPDACIWLNQAAYLRTNDYSAALIRFRMPAGEPCLAEIAT